MFNTITTKIGVRKMKDLTWRFNKRRLVIKTFNSLYIIERKN